MALHPDFPVVEGHYQMTKEWAISLPLQFNRRIEDGSLVLWRPGLTAWILVWGNDKNQTKEQRLAWIKGDQNPTAYSMKEQSVGPRLYYSYRVPEPAQDKRVPSLQCFVFGENSHVQMSVYFNTEQDLPTAEKLCSGLTNE